MPAPSETDTLLAYLGNPDVHIVAHLAQNAIDRDKDQLQLSDFTECNFIGYAPISSFDWQDVGTPEAIIAQVLSDVLTFESSDLLTVPQQVTALYLSLREGDNPPVLWQCEIFETPVVFDRPNQRFTRQVRVNSAGFAAA